MKHNQYFGGAVQSLSFRSADQNATVGVIEPGTYTFNTSTPERMSVVTGTLMLHEHDGIKRTIGPSMEFTIPAGAEFKVECDANVVYICYYG